MKTIIVLTLIMMLALPLISAEASYTFQQNKQVNLQVPVFDIDNAPATSNITCTLNVRSPTQVLIVNNEPMTFNAGGIYNYTFGAYRLSEIGEYPSTISCSDSADSGFRNFNIGVTKTGSVVSDAESNISTGTVYFILAFGALLIIFGMFMLGKGFWAGWVGVFTIIFGFILLYYDLSLVNYYVNNITLSGGTTTAVFTLVARFIKLLPYVTILIIGFAVVAIFKAVKKSKNSGDGWDNNSY